MRTQKRFLLCLALINFLACVPSNEPWDGDKNPPPRMHPPGVMPEPSHPIGEPREKTRVIIDGRVYIFDYETREWYEEGVEPRKYLGPNVAPGQKPEYKPENMPDPEDDPCTREELGLVPDADGNLAIRVLGSNYVPVSPGKISLEDRLDFQFVAERSWELPHHADAIFLAEVGEERLHYLDVLIADDEGPRPLIVEFRGIKLDQAIEYFGRMGIEALNFKEGDSNYRVELDDDYEHYQYVTATKDGDLVGKVKLR